MNVFAKWIVAQDSLRQVHRLREFLFLFSYARERLEHPQILLAIVRPLVFDPIIVASLQELAAVKTDRLFVETDATFEITLAPRTFTIGNEPIKLFGVDAVRKFRAQLVLTIAISQKVLLQGLVAVQCLANVGHGG